MERLRIPVFIDRSLAIAAGRTQYGETEVSPTEEQLAALTTEQRQCLADIFQYSNGTDTIGLRPHGESRIWAAYVEQIADSEWSTVVACLDARIARIAAVQEEQKKEDEVCNQEWAAWVAWAQATPESERHKNSGAEFTRATPRGSPVDPDIVNAVADITEAKERAYQAHYAKIRDEKKAAVEKAAIEKEAKKATFEAERLAWISEHGSERLRALAEHGFPLAKTYRAERLARDLPGWVWAAEICGYAHDIRDPSFDAINALRDAQQAEPSTALVWWGGDSSAHLSGCDCPRTTDSSYDYEDDPPAAELEGRPALRREFLGREVVLLCEREVVGVADHHGGEREIWAGSEVAGVLNRRNPS